MTEAEERQARFDTDNERAGTHFMAFRNAMKERADPKNRKFNTTYEEWLEDVNISLRARNAGTVDNYPHYDFSHDYSLTFSPNSVAAHVSNKELKDAKLLNEIKSRVIYL
jgi:hypothetical protein